MGPGVGVKNADPSVTVVMGGLSSTSTDYVRALKPLLDRFGNKP